MSFEDFNGEDFRKQDNMFIFVFQWCLLMIVNVCMLDKSLFYLFLWLCCGKFGDVYDFVWLLSILYRCSFSVLHPCNRKSVLMGMTHPPGNSRLFSVCLTQPLIPSLIPVLWQVISCLMSDLRTTGWSLNHPFSLLAGTGGSPGPFPWTPYNKNPKPGNCVG